MNRVLAFCWREWRAQRGMLLGYCGIVLVALCLVCSLMHADWWANESRRAIVLSWFVAAGVVGVLAFTAPALVRSELGNGANGTGSRGDQFVQRLPGALMPSFVGKVLFLALATAALPVAFLLVGHGLLLALGKPWCVEMFCQDLGDAVFRQWIWPAVASGYAALLIPWVWMLGTWLPGGRMALGGTALLVLLLGFVVLLLLGLSPGIQQVIAWQSWMGFVPCLGCVGASVSWAKGRRGGGPLRSLRFGAATLAIGLLPPSLWFAERSWDYHRPDLQHLVKLDVCGLSPDHRWALAAGAAHEDYQSVVVRIDLHDGRAERIEGVHHWLQPVAQQPYVSGLDRPRFWRVDRPRVQHGVLDLQSGLRTRCALDRQRNDVVLPEAIAAAVTAEDQQRSPLRAPGNVAVWFDQRDLVFAHADGREERIVWPCAMPATVRAAGHGLAVTMGSGLRRVFDLTSRRLIDSKQVDLAQFQEVWCVRGAVLGGTRTKPTGWVRLDAATGRVEAGLMGEVLGLFDDDHLLCRPWTGQQLFLWRVADGAHLPLALPAGTPSSGHVQVLAPPFAAPSLLPRDPHGRIWLWATDRNTDRRTILLLDVARREVTLAPAGFGDTDARLRLLGWPDADAALLHRGAVIQRVDVATGVATQLFPRTNEAKR